MNLSKAILAESSELPPLSALYEYVVAGNGLFIRGEDSRLKALVQVAPAHCHGLADLVPIAALNVERVPGVWLRSILASARRKMPYEALYQFHYDGAQHHAVTRTWRCSTPPQTVTPTGVKFEDDGLAVIDLHSHNSMAAFFSTTDDADEQGLRFYAVIGHVDTDTPEIRVRVGVYGHFMDVPADMVFDDLGPFVDVMGEDEPEAIHDPSGDSIRQCRMCGCTDEHGCANGCFWVADDLCSNCVEVPTEKDRLMHLVQEGWA